MKLLAALVALPLWCHGAQIPATIQDVSSQFTSINRGAIHTVDGSGLDAANPPHHDTDPTHMWLNFGDGADSGTADPDRPTQLGHITFSLGSTVSLASFWVWNYNEVN